MPETNFFWDPLSDNILRERDETGAVTAEYTTEPGLYGNVISQNRGGVESQFHFDAIGSTLALTNDNQTVTDTRTYAAFGETVEQSGFMQFSCQYIGQHEYWRDSLTGQYLIRQRTYEPCRARWTSIDPVRKGTFETGLYIYGSNSPLNRIDPSGLLTIRPVGSTLGRLGCDDVAEIRWNFHIDYKLSDTAKGAPCDGFIVQKISFICTTDFCNPKKFKDLCEVDLDSPQVSQEFWELWEVKKGSDSPERPFGAKNDDSATNPFRNTTCGFRYSRGEARFYCKSPLDDPTGNKVGTGELADWQTLAYGTAPCAVRTNRSTDIKPPFWDKPPVDGPASRYFYADWYCCGDCKEDVRRAYATATPK